MNLASFSNLAAWAATLNQRLEEVLGRRLEQLLTFWAQEFRTIGVRCARLPAAQFRCEGVQGVGDTKPEEELLIFAGAGGFWFGGLVLVL